MCPRSFTACRRLGRRTKEVAVACTTYLAACSRNSTHCSRGRAAGVRVHTRTYRPQWRRCCDTRDRHRQPVAICVRARSACRREPTACLYTVPRSALLFLLFFFPAVTSLAARAIVSGGSLGPAFLSLVARCLRCDVRHSVALSLHEFARACGCVHIAMAYRFQRWRFASPWR